VQVQCLWPATLTFRCSYPVWCAGAGDGGCAWPCCGLCFLYDLWSLWRESSLQVTRYHVQWPIDVSQHRINMVWTMFLSMLVSMIHIWATVRGSSLPATNTLYLVTTKRETSCTMVGLDPETDNHPTANATCLPSYMHKQTVAWKTAVPDELEHL
jgi:hypothetical protein